MNIIKKAPLKTLYIYCLICMANTQIATAKETIKTPYNEGINYGLQTYVSKSRKGINHSEWGVYQINSKKITDLQYKSKKIINSSYLSKRDKKTTFAFFNKNSSEHNLVEIGNLVKKTEYNYDYNNLRFKIEIKNVEKGTYEVSLTEYKSMNKRSLYYYEYPITRNFFYKGTFLVKQGQTIKFEIIDSGKTRTYLLTPTMY